MAKLIFIGVENDPTEAAECEVYGTVFPRGEAVTVSDELFAQLSENPAFKVAPKVGRPPKADKEGIE